MGRTNFPNHPYKRSTHSYLSLSNSGLNHLVSQRMNLPTAEVTAVTPTNTGLDTDQKERLEELLIEERRKLREAEEKIAKLAEDLREKDAAIAQLRDDNHALKEMLRRKLEASPQLDEDVSMAGTGNPDGHGEPVSSPAVL